MGAVLRPFASRATDSVLKTSGTNGRWCDGTTKRNRGNRLGRSTNQIAPLEWIERLRSRSGLGSVKAKSPLQWQYLFLHFACSNSCFEVVSTQNETGKRFEKWFNGLWTSSGSGITMARSRKKYCYIRNPWVQWHSCHWSKSMTSFVIAGSLVLLNVAMISTICYQCR